MLLPIILSAMAGQRVEAARLYHQRILTLFLLRLQPMMTVAVIPMPAVAILMAAAAAETPRAEELHGREIN
jgi:hypothetical protein